MGQTEDALCLIDVQEMAFPDFLEILDSNGQMAHGKQRWLQVVYFLSRDILMRWATDVAWIKKASDGLILAM